MFNILSYFQSPAMPSSVITRVFTLVLITCCYNLILFTLLGFYPFTHLFSQCLYQVWVEKQFCRFRSGVFLLLGLTDDDQEVEMWACGSNGETWNPLQGAAFLINLRYKIILALCWSGAMSGSPKYYLACSVSRLHCFGFALENLLFILLQLSNFRGIVTLASTVDGWPWEISFSAQAWWDSKPSAPSSGKTRSRLNVTLLLPVV